MLVILANIFLEKLYILVTVLFGFPCISSSNKIPLYKKVNNQSYAEKVVKSYEINSKHFISYLNISFVVNKCLSSIDVNSEKSGSKISFSSNFEQRLK